MLFLLICILVTVSVSMASLSNVGKIRGNLAEQQKYLTLSSALRLVCGQLTGTGCQYQGRYSYHYIPEETDDDGNVTQEERRIYRQLEGGFQCGLNQTANVILPLVNDLDALFARNFKPLPGQGGSAYEFTPLPQTQMFPRGPHRLVLTVEDAGGAPHPDFAEKVTVTVELWSTGAIYLTATLGEGDGNAYLALEAELVPSDAPAKLLCVEASPWEGTNSTAAMRWTLNRISKRGEAEG